VEIAAITKESSQNTQIYLKSVGNRYS